MSRKPFFLIFFVLAGFLQTELKARDYYKVIKKDKEFYRVIKNAPFVVALFMSLDKHSPNREEVLQQRSDFGYVSSKRFYSDGDVLFMIVDLSKRGLETLAKTFKISQSPTILLFEYEVPVKNKEGELITLKGFADDQSIDSFIDDFLGSSIEDYIQRKAEIRQEQRERFEAAQEYNRPSLYYGIGFPGGGYGGYPACDYSWPYNTGYGYNCGNWGYYYGYPSFNFGVNVPL